MIAPLTILLVDTQARTVTVRLGGRRRRWPITNLYLYGRQDPGDEIDDIDEADIFVAGRDGEGWIAERFSDCADLIR